jgi:hypothetical protein
LIQDDQISVSRVGMSHKVGEVEIAERSVKVSKSVMQKMVLPLAMSTLTDELRSSGYLERNGSSEWTMHRLQWDKAWEKWANLRGE